MTDKIENVERQKMAVEKSVETLQKNLVSEAKPWKLLLLQNLW